MTREKRIEPIKPNDIMDNLEDIIHPDVIRAVNEILKDKYRGSRITFTLKEIKAKAISYGNISDKEIDEKKWLDFESIYRKAGWVVNYDRPGWDENYDSFFEFSVKK